MEFEWDPDKAEINLRKHGVSFAKQGQYLEMNLQSPSLIQTTLMMKIVTLQLDGQTAAGC